MEFHLPLPNAPQAAGIARRELREALMEWGVCERVDDAVLIVSELATNAVRYGADPIALHASLNGGVLVIAVQDGFPSDLPYPKILTFTEPSGRGMHLISAASNRWGWDRTDASKVVWAEITLTALTAAAVAVQ